jgi:LysM repeat protein
MPDMSTAAALVHQSLMGESPALRLLPTTVPPGPAGPVRPALRVLEGGRAPASLAQRATYRRRRVLVAALLVLTALAVVLLVGAISTGLAGGGHPSSAAGASSPTSAAAASAAGVAAPAGQVHVVQPGDTLWSIAAQLTPHSDLRRTVDRLVATNGTGPLTVGQHLRLP